MLRRQIHSNSPVALGKISIVLSSSTSTPPSSWLSPIVFPIITLQRMSFNPKWSSVTSSYFSPLICALAPQPNYHLNNAQRIVQPQRSPVVRSRPRMTEERAIATRIGSQVAEQAVGRGLSAQAVEQVKVSATKGRQFDGTVSNFDKVCQNVGGYLFERRVFFVPIVPEAIILHLVL